MKSSQVPFLPLGIGAVFVSAITFLLYGQFLQGDQTRRERFRVRGATNFEGLPDQFERSGRKVSPGVEMTEAPTGFDNLTQRIRPQGRRSSRSRGYCRSRCVPSTTTASSSRKSRRSRTASARPTTRRAAASAIRTS